MNEPKSPEELTELVYALGRRVASLELALEKLQGSPVQPPAAPPVDIEPPASPVPEQVPQPTVAETPEPTPIVEEMPALAEVAKVTEPAPQPPSPPPLPTAPPPADLSAWLRSRPQGREQQQAPTLPASATPAAPGDSYLSSREFAGEPEAAPRREPEAPKDFETAILPWILRAAGVLLVLGIIFISALTWNLVPVALKVAGGYVLSAGVTGLGLYLAGRGNRAGRLCYAIGLSMAFAISFAAHFIPATRVFGAIPSIGLMAALTCVLVVSAERWESEATAAWGFMLGIIAALASARESQSFALVALLVITIGAGFLLVRREWKRLTAGALVLTYLSMLVLWAFAPPAHEAGVVQAHLGALVAYHVVFSVAFLRWSRAWVARELAAAQATETEVLPEHEPGVLPYSMSFDIINMVAFSALSLLLVWNTQVYWPKVHLLLFGLGAVSVGRMSLKTFRRGDLAGFHALGAFGFLTAGLVAATSGLAGSAVLALETLAVAIAASRTRLLRWLRPLGAISAALATRGFSPTGLTSVSAVLSWLMPAIFLLASALPWERIFVRRPQRFATGFLLFFERLSGQFRSLVALGLVGQVLDRMASSGTPLQFVVGTIALILVLGMVLLRASAWFLGAGLTAVVALLIHGLGRLPEPATSLVVLVGGCVLVYLWQEFSRREHRAGARVCILLALVPIALSCVPATYNSIQRMEAYQGLTSMLAALAVVLVGTFGYAAPEFPTLVAAWPIDESMPGSPRADTAWGRMRLGWISGFLVAILGTGLIITRDSHASLFSATVVSGTLGVAWLGLARSKRLAVQAEAAMLLLALGTALPSNLVRHHFSNAAVAGDAALVLVLLALAVALRRHVAAVLCLGVLVLVPLAFPIPEEAWRMEFRRDLWVHPTVGSGYGVLAGLALVAAARIAALFKGEEGQGGAIAGLSSLLIVEGAVVGMVFLAGRDLVRAEFVTPAWGVLGMALLAGGFFFLDRTMRYTAFFVFLCGCVRMLLYDLQTALARAAGFMGMGLVLLAAWVAYTFMAKRLAGRGSGES